MSQIIVDLYRAFNFCNDCQVRGARTAMTFAASMAGCARSRAGTNSASAPMALTPPPTARSPVRLSATRTTGVCTSSTVSVRAGPVS